MIGGKGSPQKPLVLFHAAALQELNLSLLKRPLPMMLLLMGDIFADRLTL